MYIENGVTVAGSATWKPYSYLDDKGNPVGFFVDYWNKWSEKSGVPVSFRLTTWDESIRLVASGECDIHSGAYYTEDRAKIFGFSKPVFFSKGVVVVRSDVKCSPSLADKMWGGVRGSEELRFAQRRSTAPVRPFKSSVELFTALVDGQVDVIVDDWAAAVMLGSDLGVSDSLVICEDVYTHDLRGMVRKENTTLLSMINEGVQKITDAEHRVMVNRWYVDHHKRDPRLGYIALVTIAITIFIAGIALSRKLRKA